MDAWKARASWKCLRQKDHIFGHQLRDYSKSLGDKRREIAPFRR